jgi:anti-sigma regulatory factor (Ser/Thr protein kinase)
MDLKEQQLKLSISNNLDVLSVVIEMARQVSKLMGFPEKETNRIEMAVEEAVGNIIRFAFEEGTEDTIDIVFDVKTLGLGISVFEKGMPFDPALVGEFSPEKFNKDFGEEGLGMYLMKKLMDQFSFINHGKAGKETRLFKFLACQSVEDVMDSKSLENAKIERVQESLPKGSVEYDVRPLKPAEAVEVSKCAYTSYGFTYVHEDIYFPERVREMNKNGDLISFVCATPDGEIIAHAALEKENDQLVPQFGVAVTKPRYRGQGCLNKLNIALMEDAVKRGFMGVFGRGITTHFFSQKSMLKHQLYPCALLLSSGMERNYKGIDQKKIQRESVVLQFRYINRPAGYKIFLPEKHWEMILEIYGFIKGEPEILTPGQGLQLDKEASIVHVKTNLSSKTSDIIIRKFGLDILQLVQEKLRVLCQERTEAIYLYMRLSDPFTAFLCNRFESMGFFFAGIMPASGNGDMLILQFLNNYEIDFDYIELGCPEAQKITDYVRKNSNNQTIER